ncbi:FAD-binding protein [Actinomadura fulvescens]|uniref:FAD-binding oxidoreductase n=1 Tax=Actinomadura fulvescens TaxID=46160 RepID=A0ABN3PW26_9ACTN
MKNHFQPSRRGFIAGAALGATPIAALPTALPAQAAGGAAGPGGRVVTPDDPRYPDLVWGANQRWIGAPEAVHVAGSTGDVAKIVRAAVRAGRRIAVRSGGHCYENFVGDPAVRVVLDLSRLDEVTYDPRRRAFAVEAGATLGDVYRGLYKDWGVTIPGGSCPTVGVGGHIAGGGFGPLSRSLGLTVDHLAAVEVVVVDADGGVRTVLATRAASDPHHDLWWAHTGGGGGNFGVVTRYWFRSPGATGDDAGSLLPRPPSEVLVSTVAWGWPTVNETSFARLLKNFGTFHERNSSPGSPYAAMFSQFNLTHKSAGGFAVTTQIDARTPNAERLLDDYLAAVNEGVGVPTLVLERRRLPWLHAATQWPGFAATDTTTRFKGKSAYLRKGLSDEQIAAFHKHLTRADYHNPTAIVMLMSHGGKVNTVAPGATAVAQRDSVIKANYIGFWTDQARDDEHVAWVRDFYRDVYADTGGVPVPGDRTDGCFINYADADLADPKWNGSQVAWHRLYYKDNYPRLQQVKARWDPRNVFHHALSIPLPKS